MKAMVGGVMMAGCVSACLISPVIPIGSGKSAKQSQHESLGKLYPAQLAALHKQPGALRTAKIRVWADDEYRAQNLRWQHGFDEQLDYVNQVLIPMLGVKVEPEYREWDHHATPGGALGDELAVLADHDPGEDVTWVVALTSSLTLVAADFEQLGVAHLGGRHLIVRGHADLEERKAFERAFPDLHAEERAQVLEARRRHKTTAVLLHEMAHSLGALHETEPDGLMNPIYSHRAASISDRNRDLMLISLEDRLKPTSERDARTTARRLLAALDPAWGGWVAEERTEQMASLEARVGSQTSAGEAGDLPPAIRDAFHHAEQLLASGDHAGAHATLEPMLAAYPAHTQLRMLDCRIELARGGPKDARAIATCERAAALSTEVEPAIAVAAVRLSAGDAAGARRTLIAAEARTASLPPAQAMAGWLTLADAYKQMGAVTWAELAIAKAAPQPGADHGIPAWAAMTRVRYGVPRDGARYKLAPDDDAAAINAVRGVVALVNASKLAEAAKAAGVAERRWPGLPGLLAARCDLELRRGSPGSARALCSRAGAHGGSSWALYLGGIIELQREGGTAGGIARLREAIALDPELGQAWRALGKALERSKATAELDQLRHDYQARFGSALPI
jgi:tetratricopeptide (TPR) repeat protein